MTFGYVSGLAKTMIMLLFDDVFGKEMRKETGGNVWNYGRFELGRSELFNIHLPN